MTTFSEVQQCFLKHHIALTITDNYPNHTDIAILVLHLLAEAVKFLRVSSTNNVSIKLFRVVTTVGIVT